MGASIHLAAVDVGDELQLRSFLKKFQAEGWPPITGVVHAAGIMQYQPMIEHEATAMQDVLRPKASGGWLLHQLLKDSPLDFFILFSSNSALLSSPMMGSYAAANTFLDALAHHRKALGKPALSINWGTWAETGMVTNFTNQARQVGLRGVGTIATRQGLDALERLVQGNKTQVAVMPIDWKEWQTSYQVFRDIPMLSQLMRESVEAHSIQPEGQGLSREILLSAEPETRQNLLVSYLRDQVGRVLGLKEDHLSLQQPLTDLGLDSLMAVELKNRIENNLGVAVPMVEFLRGPSLNELSTRILEQLTQVNPQSNPQSGRDTEEDNRERTERILSQIDQLSNEQMDSLLSDLLIGEEE
jgi:acyl carrier protein